MENADIFSLPYLQGKDRKLLSNVNVLRAGFQGTLESLLCISAVGGDPRLLSNLGLRKKKLPVATGQGTCIARVFWRVEDFPWFATQQRGNQAGAIARVSQEDQVESEETSITGVLVTTRSRGWGGGGGGRSQEEVGENEEEKSHSVKY